jgi:nucleotide-binding universal stress UspA family protein
LPGFVASSCQGRSSGSDNAISLAPNQPIHKQSSLPEFTVPAALLEIHRDREDARPWLDALPELTSGYLDQWALRLDGNPLYGAASLVLPVVRHDGTGAMLKLQPLRDETAGEALGLRIWNGDGVVLVLEDDPATGTILLERLDPRMLSDLPNDQEATQILAELLARLSAVQAPPTLPSSARCWPRRRSRSRWCVILQSRPSYAGPLRGWPSWSASRVIGCSTGTSTTTT